MHDLKSNTHPADALASIRKEIRQLESAETALKKSLIADREARVGVSHHAVVDRRCRETVDYARVIEDMRAVYFDLAETIDRLTSADIDGMHTGLTAHMRRWDDAEFESRQKRTKKSEYEQVSIEAVPDIAEILRLLDGPCVYLDTETTGFSHAVGDRVVSLGLHFTTHDGISNRVMFFNPQGKRSSAQALEVNGLIEEFLATQKPFAECANKIRDRITGHTLVAHNAPFDMGFLRAEFARTLIDFPSVLGVVDTRVLSKLLWPGESATLDAVCERLGIPARTGKHDALADAKLVAEVVNRVRPLLEARLADDQARVTDIANRSARVLADLDFEPEAVI